MVFTWDATDLCIVFRQWHIRSTLGLLVSLAAVVAIAAGYEALRASIRRFEVWADRRSETAPRRSLRPVALFPCLITCPLLLCRSLRSLSLSLPSREEFPR